MEERSEMGANQYGAVLPRWKNDLIIARAKRMGLRGPELLEAQQELVLHVAAFQHEPSRSNGASKETALIAVIDRRLKALCRSRSRFDRHQQCARDQRAVHTRCTDARSNVDQHLLALDVREAIARLTPREQLVCKLLGEGESVARIAEELGCGWHTVRRIIARLRALFQDMGLDGWVIEG